MFVAWSTTLSAHFSFPPLSLYLNSPFTVLIVMYFLANNTCLRSFRVELFLFATFQFALQDESISGIYVYTTASCCMHSKRKLQGVRGSGRCSF